MDRNVVKREESVRHRGYDGQKGCQKRRKCPSSSACWTEKLSKEKKVSVIERMLDRKVVKREESVRHRGYDGQKCSQKRRKSTSSRL
jgi:hypothetical protein